MKKNDSIVEAYVEMIAETPYIEKSNSPDVISSGAVPLRKYITDNHHKAKCIDLEKNHYHLKYGKDDLYYRHDGNDSKELSCIRKNVQTGVEKGPTGDSANIHEFMKHHIKENGVLKSSNSNTEGSKKLWINFIKNNPHLNHFVLNVATGHSTVLNKDNIDKHSNTIWGSTDNNKNLQIVSRK